MLHRLAVATIVTAAIAVVPASSGQATAPPSGLRLITGFHHVDVNRFGEEPELFFPVAVYVAPTGGAFQVEAVRHAGGGIAYWQTRPGSGAQARVRQIYPPRSARIDAGLPDFFVFTLRTASGQVVAQRRQPFCPTGDFGSARVDASGPSNPSYPFFCGSAMTRRMVWGIDKGWASPVFPGLSVKPALVPDGDYTLTVSVNHAYVQQLHMNSALATTTLTVSITTATDKPCRPDIACEARAAVAGAHTGTTRPLARPHVPSGSAYRFSDGLPDLVALPAHDLQTNTGRRKTHDFLDFGATIWNAGPGTLDVEGFRAGSKPVMAARQFLYRNGRPAASRAIGTFAFDNRPGHHHWHLEDVARYDLLSTRGHVVVRSHKQSFCLAPTDAVDLTRPGALWQPDAVGLSSSCPSDQSIWLRETLPVGWGDTYVQSAGGQAFDITNVPNGEYLIRVTTNPRHHILETTTANDTSLVAVELGGVRGARTVKRIGPASG